MKTKSAPTEVAHPKRKLQLSPNKNHDIDIPPRQLWNLRFAKFNICRKRGIDKKPSEDIESSPIHIFICFCLAFTLYHTFFICKHKLQKNLGKLKNSLQSLLKKYII